MFFHAILKNLEIVKRIELIVGIYLDPMEGKLFFGVNMEDGTEMDSSREIFEIDYFGFDAFSAARLNDQRRVEASSDL